MLEKLKAFFDSLLAEESGHISEDKKRLACAALLIEVAVIDQNFDTNELLALQNLLSHQFSITADQLESLIELAKAEVDTASSMYQFTSLVNNSCSHTEKFELLKGMWQIAFADGELDKYEEYIIRKVCDLIYMSHGDFIRAKHIARDS